MFRHVRLFLCCAALLAAWVGCTQWRPEKEESSLLSPPRMSPDSVTLEIAYVRLTPAENPAHVEFWRTVDEQHLPAEVRRELRQSGFRCGLVGTRLPPVLRRRLEAEVQPFATPGQNQTAIQQLLSRHRQLQCRAGRRETIAAGPPRAEVVLPAEGESDQLTQTLEKAQCQFALRVYPQGDGRVQLELTPEIEHGEPRTRFVPNEGSFLAASRRDRKAFERLRIEATLSPGQMLLVGAGHPRRALGRAFFDAASPASEENDEPSDSGQILVLIRVAHTQLDDLFAPTQARQPLVTPLH